VSKKKRFQRKGKHEDHCLVCRFAEARRRAGAMPAGPVAPHPVEKQKYVNRVRDYRMV
jgi:hypothetical protein